MSKRTLFFLVVGSLALLAEDPPPAVEMEAELRALLDTPVELAARTGQEPRRAPAIMSVITRKDIEAFGARDLSDVLKRVPGFQFGLDVSAALGQGFRGIWAHEAKTLVMMDGVTVNELGFGSFNVFQAVPASMIEKVEVMRGPGSALYGGFAEMAVISVSTIRAGDAPGGRATLAGEQLAGTSAYRAGLDMAATAGGNGTVAVSMGLMNGPTAVGDYRDPFGHQVVLDRSNANRMWEHAVVDSRMGPVNLTYVHYLSTRLGQTGFDQWVPPTPEGLNLERNRTRFDSLRGTATFHPTKQLELVFMGAYANGTPLNTVQYNAGLRGNRQGPGADISRTQLEVSGTYTVWEAGRLTAGLGFGRDQARNVLSDGGPGLHAEVAGVMVHDRSAHSNYAYAQYLHQLDKVGLTAGVRQESTSFGSATAPRVGLTYVEGAFNLKILAGQAFRIPLVWQATRFDNPVPLRPEKATSYEVEAGYRFAPSVELRTNVFRVSIKDAMVGLVNFNVYKNSGDVATQGFETELQARYPGWGGYVNLSFSRPTGDTVQDFLDADRSRFLGFARLKAAAGGYVKLGKVQTGLTVVYLGPRPAQSDASAQNQLQVPDQTFLIATTDLKSVFLVDANATWNGILPGMDLQLALQNLLDQDYRLPQPYYGAQAPFPADGRRVSLQLTWRF